MATRPLAIGTGGSGAIGLAIAARLLRGGSRVALLSRHAHTAVAARQHLLRLLTIGDGNGSEIDNILSDGRPSLRPHRISVDDFHSQLFETTCDACVPGSAAAALATVLSHFGSSPSAANAGLSCSSAPSAAPEFPRINTLICAAGVSADALSLRQSDADIANVLQTNLIAAMSMSREVSRYMIRHATSASSKSVADAGSGDLNGEDGRSAGCIINIGSVIGAHGGVGQTAYAASKAGLVGFSKSLAKELASRRIRVNVVSPGFIDTPMTRALSAARRQQVLDNIPLKRFGRADDVAAIVEFLASPAAAYVTGQEWTVDGGMCM